MSKVVLFAGTTEGRILANKLSDLGVESAVFVATDYGFSLLHDCHLNSNVALHAGRLTTAQIEEMLEKENPDIIIDSTHPYADLVSKNIVEACPEQKELIILERPELQSHDKNLHLYDSMDAMIDALNQNDHKIFSTLGSKALPALTKVKNYRERVVVRILPALESLESAVKLDFAPKNILCMQGPFSKDLNIALFKASSATIMLTKDTGSTGGLQNKIDAANACNMDIAMLNRPLPQKNTTQLELKDIIKLLDSHFGN